MVLPRHALIVSDAKERGAYYTPTKVARSLVDWVVRKDGDRLLDPSCGDGQFLVAHPNSVGVERDGDSAVLASQRAPGSVVHIEDFFQYARLSNQRFDCVAGNPPFIRFQRFAGEARQRALTLCAELGVQLTGLCSSWAPFVVAASTLLKPNGRLALVVPAEIGHAPYAAPIVKYLMGTFRRVQLVAIRERVFQSLSQDVWLLFAEGYGKQTDSIAFTAWEQFKETKRPPRPDRLVGIDELASWRDRLRPFLVNDDARALYARLAADESVRPLGDVAKVGIGYVTGANDFFHLRPSEAEQLDIPSQFLKPAVMSGRSLRGPTVSRELTRQWKAEDKRFLLLHLTAAEHPPKCVQRYLDSPAGRAARRGYKCSNRRPWYAVPDVTVPDGFLTYMSGTSPNLVANRADCVCTNSLHAVRCMNGVSFARLQKAWRTPLASLSCEVEGHALGGGMLKLEPREAGRVLLPLSGLDLTGSELHAVEEAADCLRRWRLRG